MTKIVDRRDAGILGGVYRSSAGVK